MITGQFGYKVNGSKNTRSPQFRHPPFTSILRNYVEGKTEFDVAALTAGAARASKLGRGRGGSDPGSRGCDPPRNLPRSPGLARGSLPPCPSDPNANRNAIHLSIFITSKE